MNAAALRAAVTKVLEEYILESHHEGAEMSPEDFGLYLQHTESLRVDCQEYWDADVPSLLH